VREVVGSDGTTIGWRVSVIFPHGS